MKAKQIIKYIKHYDAPTVIMHEEDENNVKGQKNKDKNINENMKAENIAAAEELMNTEAVPQKVKVVKKDKGLIERTESSKIILTEDNRQVLND